MSHSPGEVDSDGNSMETQAAPTMRKKSEDEEARIRSKLLERRAERLKEITDVPPKKKKGSTSSSPPKRKVVAVFSDPDDAGDSIMEDFHTIHPPQAALKHKKHSHHKKDKHHRERERERPRESSERDKAVRDARAAEGWASWKGSLSRDGGRGDGGRPARETRRPVLPPRPDYVSSRGSRDRPRHDRAPREEGSRSIRSPIQIRKRQRSPKEDKPVKTMGENREVGHLSPHSPSPPVDEGTPVMDESHNKGGGQDVHAAIYGQPIVKPFNEGVQKLIQDTTDSDSTSDSDRDPMEEDLKNHITEEISPNRETSNLSKKYSKFESSPEEEGELDYVMEDESETDVDEVHEEEGNEMGEEATEQSDEKDESKDLAEPNVSAAEVVEEEVYIDPVSLLPCFFPGISGCRSVEEFHCLNRIEEGTYGVVYRAEEKRTVYRSVVHFDFERICESLAL